MARKTLQQNNAKPSSEVIKYKINAWFVGNIHDVAHQPSIVSLDRIERNKTRTSDSRNSGQLNVDLYKRWHANTHGDGVMSRWHVMLNMERDNLMQLLK